MSSTKRRRSILQALALGAGSLSFGDLAKGPWLGSKVVQAAITGPPRRVLFVTHPNGTRIEGGSGWEMSWGKKGAAPTDVNFGAMNKPFERHKSDVVILDGVNLHPTQEGDQHVQGYLALWTAKMWENAAQRFTMKSLGPSIDQYLADKLGKLLTPKNPTIALGAQSMVGDQSAVYALDGTFIAPIQDPYAAFKRLFDGINPQGAMPDAALMSRLKRRQSVLDSVVRDLNEFQKGLPSEDRARAQAQLDAVRTLESRLSTNAGAPSSSCVQPIQKAGLNLKAPENQLEVLKMHLDLLAAAFSCDATRIGMLNLGGLNGMMYPPVNSPHDIHAMSHDYMDELVLTKQTWFEQLASFADRLKSIPEPRPDGTMGSMLDNTVMIIGSEISHGHTHQRIPFMTVGGRNLGIKTGQYLYFPYRSTLRPDGFWEEGQPHGNLLTHILNCMGLPDTSFGETQHNSLAGRPIPGFMA